jgi:hypothetical protein
VQRRQSHISKKLKRVRLTEDRRTAAQRITSPLRSTAAPPSVSVALRADFPSPAAEM